MTSCCSKEGRKVRPSIEKEKEKKEKRIKKKKKAVLSTCKRMIWVYLFLPSWLLQNSNGEYRRRRI